MRKNNPNVEPAWAPSRRLVRCAFRTYTRISPDPVMLKQNLRWRARTVRIGRDRQVIGGPGLKVFLLLTQQAAAQEGAQLAAGRPCPRAGSR